LQLGNEGKTEVFNILVYFRILVSFLGRKSMLSILLLVLWFSKVWSDQRNVWNTPALDRLRDEDMETVHTILHKLLSWMKSDPVGNQIPFVTLSYAQSLDGMIASSQQSSNLPISCTESLVMTHALRSIHDAVLVGGNTMAIDNPRLNVRCWTKRENFPRPVVLDTNLRHISDKWRAKNVIVCCSKQAAEFYGAEHRVKSSSNIEICACDANENGLDLRDVIFKLRQKYGIKSIMVEGGSSVLSAFIKANLVDCLCATVSPTIIGGEKGLCAFRSLNIDNDNLPMLQLVNSTFFPVARDVILLARLR